MQVLGFDIGGTKVIAGSYQVDGKELSLVAKERFDSDGFASLQAVATAFLEHHPMATIDAIGIGVAGPVLGNEAKVTNLPWTVNTTDLAATGCSEVTLINDLQAHAYGLFVHAKDQFVSLNRGEPLAGNKGIVAPGTGLGEAVLYYYEPRQTWVPSATEGGHTDFGPFDEFDDHYLQFLRRRYGGRISQERVVSGGEGFANLYDFLVKEKGAEEVPGVEPTESCGPALVAAAVHDNHPTAVKVMERFVIYLGREAANLALKGLTTGGLYLAGGVTSGILPWLKEEAFLEAFTDKGRFAGMLRHMPVDVVTDPDNGLRGAVYAASLRTMKGE